MSADVNVKLNKSRRQHDTRMLPIFSVPSHESEQPKAIVAPSGRGLNLDAMILPFLFSTYTFP